VKTPAKKPIIGILGGIASGKSTVAAELARLGCKVIDADKIAHEFLDKKKVKGKVVDLFGPNILNASGKIDRAKLARLVFSDPAKLDSLNRIIHPLVHRRTQQLISKYKKQKRPRAIVLDMPLLLETGWQKKCDRLIFVDSKTPLRLKRAKKIGIFKENQLKIRENFQISLDTKAAISDNTVDNNSDFSALAKQVKDIFSYIVDNGQMGLVAGRP
jgi:dephospho-CoA kinase